MTKETVNKSEKNMYRYGLQDRLCGLYNQSLQGKQFRHLMKYIISEENIVLAYRNICKNNGSFTAGVDGKTIRDIQKYPIQLVVRKVRNKLIQYQPKQVRRVYIDKGNGKQRPLGIPSIWDRLIQQCVLQVLEPICEAKFHERSNGFRPYRSTQNAIAQCYKMIQLQNLHYVVDIDIKGFFDNINHTKLIRQIWAIGIQDLKVIAIIKAMLKAEILFNDIVTSPETGTPQGGILSPLLSNIVLNELDWWVASQWETIPTRTNREYPKTDKNGFTVIDRSQKWSMLREKSKLKEIYIVRYADDFKIFCRDYNTARKTFQAVTKWLKERLSLDISTEKSGITNLEKNYPANPRMVVDLYAKTMQVLYKEEYTEGQQDKMLYVLKGIMDDELLGQQVNFSKSMKNEIAERKEGDYSISNYLVQNTEPDVVTVSGKKMCNVQCLFSLRKGTSTVATYYQFILRQDDEKRWKILGWDVQTKQ